MRAESHRSLSLASAIFLALALGLLPGPADAVEFTVDSTADAVDDSPGDGNCKTAAAECTLRAAIQESNALAGADTITLNSGLYDLTIAGMGEGAAASGDLDITDDLTIKGEGSGSSVVDGGDLDRVFDVVSGTVDISGVGIQNGTSDDDGGGVRSSGALTLSDSTVSYNSSPACCGGIVSAAGTVTLIGSIVSYNTAAVNGGGIGVFPGAAVMLSDSIVSSNTGLYGGGILSSGSLTLFNSTVNSNASIATGVSGGGGGINSGLGTLTITDSSVGGNTAKVDGGGIYILAGSASAVTITGSTITGNTADSDLDGGGRGGGLYIVAGNPAIANTTISGNTAGPDGGGIYIEAGATTLTGSNVNANNALSSGGGIRNYGTVTLIDSTLDDNGAGGGGGIRNSGTATFTGSTISGNRGSGGGIRNTGGGTTILTNSTLSGNASLDSGGGIVNNFGATVTLTNCTVTNNTADTDFDGNGDGGGIYSDGTVNVKNSVIAGNFDLSAAATIEPDCFGELNSQGYNLFGVVSLGCTIVGDFTGNITGPGANLGPLAVNAPGTTKTHALLAGSAAIDAVAVAACPPPTTDQRGVARPQGAACDMGAYEYQVPGDEVFGNGFE